MATITIILDFLNTLNRTAGYDILLEIARLSEWLSARESPPEQVPSIHDVALAVEVREALRDILIAGSRGNPAPASWEVVNRAARAVSVALGFKEGRPAMRPSGVGLEWVVASVLIAAHSAMADGTWERIRVCRNPDCRWAFYDRSRNRTRVWCTMAECGNRMKARRFRQRRKPQQAGETTPSGGMTAWGGGNLSGQE